MTTFYTVVNWLVILGYWLLIAGVTLRILMKRRAVPSAMAWLLIIYILPLVGIIDRIEVVDGEGSPRKGELSPRIVFGPTCDSVDRIPGELMLDEGITEGDYLIIHGMGAYSIATNTRFNGFGDLTIATVLSLKV